MDENYVINRTQMVNGHRFIAYFGNRHTLIEYGNYKGFYVMLICLLVSEIFF